MQSSFFIGAPFGGWLINYIICRRGCKEWVDKVGINNVLSESEFLFGYYPIYDINTLISFLDVVFEIISYFTGCSGFLGKIVDAIALIGKYYSLLTSVSESIIENDFKGFVSAIVNGFVEEDDLNNTTVPSEYASKNYTLGWAFKLLSLGSSLGVLADTFKNGPHFYKEIFGYCKTDLEYNIMLRTTDNKLIALSDINAVI